MGFTIKFCLSLVLVVFSFEVVSQTDIEIKKKNFKIEGGSDFKKAWKEIKEGESLFSEGQIYFQEALDHYLKAYDYNSENAVLNYKIGVCYLYSEEKKEAKQYLSLAHQSSPELTPDIKYLLARAYHVNMDFDQAISMYREFKGALSPKQLKRLDLDEDVGIDQLVNQCEYGKVLSRTPVHAVIKNAGSNINSEYDEYSPVVSKNDSLLLFTSRREHSKRSKKSKYDEKFYEGVYMSTKSGGEWGPAKKFFKGKVKENTAVIGMSHDGKTVYLYKGSENSGDIYYTVNRKGKWSKPKSVPGKVNSGNKEGSAALSPDGNTLYFISERKKETVGGKDIYMSQLKKNGKWDKPVNLGPTVNSRWDEAAVSLHPDGKTLYFSSKGHTSMGGYDIFKSEQDASGNWSEPQNIGYPINSTYDDLFYSPSFVGKVGYYSAIREDRLGGKDIYRVTFIGEPKELVFGSEEKLFAGEPSINRTIYFEGPTALEIEKKAQLTGIVRDMATNEPLVANVELIETRTKEMVKSTNTSNNGQYRIDIPEVNEYIAEASANGYMPSSVSLTVNEDDQEIVRNFELEKIEIGTKVVLENIYFEAGSSRLKKESYDELNKVYRFLLSNPSVRIEISGHTDNIGTLEANKRLSKQRAKACVDYLINKGIDKGRLEYEGYAFLQPVSHNHTPEGRQKNRRVEFKIVNK